MFDDKQNNLGSAPANLPTEPVDMLEGVDNDIAGLPEPGGSPSAPPDALSAGFLKKKEPIMPSSNPPVSSGETPSALAPQPVYSMKEPILGKIIMFVLLAAVLGGLGFGGWWIYQKYQGNISPVVSEVKTPTTNTNQNIVPVIQPVVEPVVEPVVVNTPAADVSIKMNNDAILFGESIDSDKDGLDDVREKELGTNPNKADTDDDGLNDGDEVLIWKTNPLNPDTDGDSFSDGQEVRNGYNPLGEGKLPNAINKAVTSTTK